MILKLLLIIGVIAVVYLFFIKKKPENIASKNNKKESEASDMVECSTCGVYVELHEAILSNAHYYCSNECIAKAK